METNLESISAAVRKVLEELVEERASLNGGPSGICETIDAAVESAVVAQKRLQEISLEKRKDLIAAIRKAALDANERLSALAVKETGLGRYEDKVRENVLCATKSTGPEDIEPRAYSGDHGLTLVEYVSTWSYRIVDSNH